MDLAQHIGPRQLQHLVVALEILPMACEARAAVVGLAQFVALDHRAHCAVDDEDALGQQGGQRRAAAVS